MSGYHKVLGACAFLIWSEQALGGPPYVSDDPEPTPDRHFEIYLYTAGTNTEDGTTGANGVDFNYGATPDLQLTAVLPIEFDSPAGGGIRAGFGNVELAAKYRILHQREIGWDVAIFPRVFLPSSSTRVGERQTSALLPVWVERDFGAWSTFGGAGYVIHRGGDARDFGLLGWALTRRVLFNLQVGAELVHQTADAKDGRATSGVGAGLLYDATENLHLLGYAGPGIQNAAATNRVSWYFAVLLTF